MTVVVPDSTQESAEQHAESMVRIMALTRLVEKMAKHLSGDLQWQASTWLPDATSLTLARDTHHRVRIHALIVVVPTGTNSAMLTIGSAQIPIQQTTTVLAPIDYVLGAYDEITLTLEPAGFASMVATGERD